MAYEQLKLNNQVCFPIYATSRLIISQYQPYLEKLGITYPQYLVLLVLWEEDELSVKEIGEKLILNSNTLTPLLKRMEKQELLQRIRSKEDERKVIVKLSIKAKEMEEEASKIPEALASGEISEVITMEEMMQLKNLLHKVMGHLNKK